MLRVKNVKSANVGQPPVEPRLTSTDDIIDVTVVREVTDGSQDFQPTGHGLFMDERPASQPSKSERKSLLERFGRKAPISVPTAASEPPAVAVAEESPVSVPPSAAAFEAEPAKSTSAEPVSDAKASKPKWAFTRASREDKTPGTPEPKATGASVVPEPVSVRPTQNVKKPIIVQKAAERKRKLQELPIRVFIGFLPEVTERDARDYALGIAERNCEQISLVFYDAFKLNDGYAYEVHEGGPGRAFLPEIITHFGTLARFEKGADEANVFIRTATRMVQVDRTLEGLQAFLLPESATDAPSEWLEGTAKMTPAIQTLRAVLVAGAGLFIAGFLSLSFAFISRIQPYEEPKAPMVEKAIDNYNRSPMSRWTAIQGVTGNEYVAALKFKDGKWDLQRETVDAQAPAPAVEPASAPN